uniref:Proteasome subunit beta type-4-like n=1 Tax=Rhizophora mucronata TaxID=61149 RepID=A0A2P2K1K3_RHIMU
MLEFEHPGLRPSIGKQKVEWLSIGSEEDTAEQHVFQTELWLANTPPMVVFDLIHQMVDWLVSTCIKLNKLANDPEFKLLKIKMI